ncbi:uncharacterized protein LOC142984280 [Anticarsia gemmatalis]|uniref:uncharacterized protein LOC142984280 n=1 Tax=Anticarsia gemmatalis TaxID=129554 RepID=UPI003F758C6C
MKVFVALVLVFACVSGRGSGPYLPSGWRPQGPAFYLPSELPRERSPAKLTQFGEIEASGFDALREYGPPKLDAVAQAVDKEADDIPLKETLIQGQEASGSNALKEDGVAELVFLSQGLPDVATDRAFLVEITSEEINAAEEAAKMEANIELVSALVEELSELQTNKNKLAEIHTTESTETPDTSTTETHYVTEQGEIVTELCEEFKEETIIPAIALAEIIEATTVTDEYLKAEAVDVSTTVAPKATSLDTNATSLTSEAEQTNITDTTLANATEEEVVVPKALGIEDVVSSTEVGATTASAASTVSVNIDTTTVLPIVVSKKATEDPKIDVSTTEGAELNAGDFILPVIDAVLPAEFDEVIVPLSQQELEKDALHTPVEDENVSEVNSIAEALINLDNEVKSFEEQQRTEDNSSPKLSGSLEQAPGGFLDFSPPGFAVYGPPKQEDLARLQVAQESSDNIASNEVRRRRYSPKFRSGKH